MAYTPDIPTPPSPRPCLRLVKPGERAAPAAGAVDAPAAPKSRIAQFLTAYADAIDRDIQAILDL